MGFFDIFKKKNKAEKLETELPSTNLNKYDLVYESSVYKFGKVNVGLEVRNPDITSSTIKELEEKMNETLKNVFETDSDALYEGLVKYAFCFISDIVEVEPEEGESTWDDIKEGLDMYTNQNLWNIINLQDKDDILNYISDLKISIFDFEDVETILNEESIIIEGNCDWEIEHGLGLVISKRKLVALGSFDITTGSSEDDPYNYLSSNNQNVKDTFNLYRSLEEKYTKLFK